LIRDFRDKVCVVTGAASGIGRATAIRLAKEGAAVACVDRNLEGANETVAAITGAGGRAFAVACDVLDLAQIDATVEQVVQRFGRIDVLCNIAGIGPFAYDEDETADWWNSTQVRAARGDGTIADVTADHLKASKGAIVNCASTAGTHAQPLSSAYSASKGGVVGMTLPIARELARFGIRVNTVAPGIFWTPMVDGMPDDVQASLAASIPFPARLGKPEEFADLVAYILGNTYLNGETIRLDGATRLAPK